MSDWLRAARETPVRGLPYYHIFDLLAFDFARSFPHGAGQLEPIFQGDEYHGLFLDERLTWPVLETAVVAYLNQNQISLKDGSPINILELMLSPKAVDLNGDGIEEWLVELKSDYLDILGVIPLTNKQSGHYAILANTIRPVDTSLYYQAAQVSFEYDFTGDDVLDVFQAKQGYFLGGTNGYIDIYTWRDNGLYLLEEIDITVGAHQPVPFFSIAQLTRDDAADVEITTFHYLNLGCEWYGVDVYSWPDSQPEHNLQFEEPPAKPECLLFHAITPVNYISRPVLEKHTRIDLLEQALAQLSLETAPSADYLALAYVHLAAAYAAQWDDELAQEAISRLGELPAQAPFVRLVNGIYEEEGGDVIVLCERLYSEPQLAESTDIVDYVHEGSIGGYFGPGSEVLNPDAICPYP